MSLFKCKDLDYLLAEKLDCLQSLLNFSLCNKYYYNLLNDRFCLNMYLKKYSSYLIKRHLYNFKNFTKKTYFEREKYLQKLSQEVIYERKSLAVSIDSVDILEIISSLFPLIQNSHHYIDLAVEKDSLMSFRYFFENSKKVKIENYYLDSCVRYKSDKILNYLFEYNYIEYTASRFDIAFHSYSPKFVELYILQMQRIEKSSKGKILYFPIDLLEEITYHLCYPYNDNTSWIENFNLAFALFMKCLTREQILHIKKICLSRDQYLAIKLITTYTSYFNQN